MRFRLVQKSTSLGDPKRPIHSCRKDAFYGAHQKNTNEDRPILYQRQKL